MTGQTTTFGRSETLTRWRGICEPISCALLEQLRAVRRPGVAWVLTHRDSLQVHADLIVREVTREIRGEVSA